MLEITIPCSELFDDARQEFIVTEEQTIKLEHSLVALHNWESKWHVPYISDKKKTAEQTLDYIKMMTITENVDPNVYMVIGSSMKIQEDIQKYMDDSQTASIVKSTGGGNTGEFVTAESIYYWMISLQIPVEFQHWHINRLLALIKFCNAKNAPKKKMSRSEILSQNRTINNARRKASGSKG